MAQLTKDKYMPNWWITKDGDADCYELFERHYSSRKNRQRKQRRFVGPGEQFVLRTLDGLACFAWRYRLDNQHGVNCTFFRNEGPVLSSDLVREADAVADRRWPGLRHYTFINAEKIRSTNPGFCFIAAGWRRRGRSKSGLIILERQ